METLMREGDIKNKYKFDKSIGEGEYSTVSKIVDLKNGDSFAAKIIDKTQLTEEEAMSLFAEIEILGTLDHPNVVRLLELYEDPEHFYMIFELMHGGTLSQRLYQRGEPLMEDEAAKFLLPVVDAIRYCHRNNVTHRDLKVNFEL